ncbi:hypothetical protein ACSBPU_00105 [Parapusillimonas sp. JC17]|uniref:hypothetical protein n=1 Tax=Parapusillimonas sp. JC17 TaxID=3445768 RepID=UPI003F9F0F15
MSNPVRIRVPQNLSLNQAINFCHRLWNDSSDAEQYEFDFGRMGHVEPFTMAYVANELKRYRATKADARFTATNYAAHSYPAHMGFFRAFGLGHGNKPGQALGSSSYIPITILPVAEVHKEADERFLNIGDVLEEKALRIAQLLVRQHEGKLVDTLTFAIREIMRNVVEHAESDFIEYCGQYWPSKGMVEVAILDVGKGVARGLQSNPYIVMSDDRDALQLALLPGISGKMYRGVKRRANDVWQNSGFGLYMTRRICGAGGSFFIVSNTAGMLFDNTGKHDRNTTYAGTALRLRFNTDAILDHDNMLDQFRKEGYATARTLSGAEAIEPSMASVMLARDFDGDR